jgi:O-antigen/teichoic acid export membrane protein
MYSKVYIPSLSPKTGYVISLHSCEQYHLFYTLMNIFSAQTDDNSYLGRTLSMKGKYGRTSQMTRLSRIVNNTVISLIGQVVTWTSTLLLTSAYGRFLGDFKFGELYFAISFVLLIGFPLEFGFNQQLTRDVAVDPGKALRYFSNTLLIKITLWFVLYGLIMLICWLLGYSTEERILVGIVGITLLSTSIANTFAALHYAFERVLYPAFGTILEKGLSALIGIILLRHGAGVQAMALVLLGGSLINATWQGIWFFRLVGSRLSVDLTLIRELIRTSLPFLIYGVLGVIYYRLDTVLLSLFTNTAVVGWYGAAYRLFDTMVFLPNLVIAAIMFPIFSKLSTSSETSLKLAIEKSMNFLLFCGIPIAGAMIAAAPNIIGFLYHRAEFIPSVRVLQALAPGLIFLYLNSVLGATIMSTKQERKMTIMAAAALVFNLGFNLFMIPLFAQNGAAIVTSLTELLLLCLSVVFTPRRLLPFGSLRVAAKACIASLVMCSAILALRNVSIFLLLPAAMLVYLVTAALLRTIPKEDIKAIYTSIRYKAQRTMPEAPVPQPETKQDLPLNGHRVPQPEAKQDLPLNGHRRVYRRIRLIPQPEAKRDLQTAKNELSTMEEVPEEEVIQ